VLVGCGELLYTFFQLQRKNAQDKNI
jgi:hypothetical protein